MSGLLSEVSPLMGGFGDGDPGGRVTCRRWVAGKFVGVLLPVDEGFFTIFPKDFPFSEQIFPKDFPFSEQIQALGSDTI